MRFVFDLPFPPSQLSPNARIHWRMKHRIGKQYKSQCHLLAKSVLLKSSYRSMQLREHIDDGDKVHLWLEFFPPDRRARDDDNLEAAFKHGRDGIAAALLVDDRHFISHKRLCSDRPVAGGSVRATITTGPIRGDGVFWPEVDHG